MTPVLFLKNCQNYSTGDCELLCEIAAEVISHQLDDHRAESQDCNQVGDCHKAIESIRQVPGITEGHCGTDNREKDKHKLIADAGFCPEEVLKAAGAVQRPAENCG